MFSARSIIGYRITPKNSKFLVRTRETGTIESANIRAKINFIPLIELNFIHIFFLAFWHMNGNKRANELEMWSTFYERAVDSFQCWLILPSHTLFISNRYSNEIQCEQYYNVWALTHSHQCDAAVAISMWSKATAWFLIQAICDSTPWQYSIRCIRFMFMAFVYISQFSFSCHWSTG